MKFYLLILLSVMGVALSNRSQAGPGHAHAEVSTSGSDGTGGIINVTEQGKRNLGIEVVEAEITEIENTLQTLVEIVAVPSRTAALASRIPGKVTKIHAVRGLLVKEGQPLVEIESFQPGNPPPSITYQSPISGTVTHWDAGVGESVEPNGHLAEIIDLSEVFAEISLFEGELHQVKIGQKVRVYVESFPKQVFEGTIELINGKLDPETRVLKVYATLKNPDQKLRPHMRGRGYIVTEKLDAAITVPHRAVTGDPGNLFAFVQTDAAGLKYEQRKIVIGTKDDRLMEIIEGVLPGEKVVVSGNYQLQFVEDRSAIPAGGGHGHDHGPGGEHLTEEDKIAHGEVPAPAANQATVAPTPLSLGDQLLTPLSIGILIALGISLILNVILASRKSSATK